MKFLLSPPVADLDRSSMESAALMPCPLAMPLQADLAGVGVNLADPMPESG
jgi:hypothetical protein